MRSKVSFHEFMSPIWRERRRAAELEFISACEAALYSGLDAETMRDLIHSGEENVKAAMAESAAEENEEDER